MSNLTIVDYVGPSALVERLHGYPRVDRSLHEAPSQFPTFSGDGATDRWVEGLEMVVLIPLAALLVLFFVEVVFRVVVCLSARGETSTLQRDRAESVDGDGTRPAGGYRMRRRSPCWVLFLVLLAVAVVLTVTAFGLMARASNSADSAGDRIDEAQGVRVAYLEAAQNMQSAAATIHENAATLLADPSIPPLVVTAVTQVDNATTSALGPLDTLVGVLGDLDLADVSAKYDRYSSLVYGGSSLTTLVLAVGTALMLVFCGLALVVPPRARAPLWSAALAVVDVLAFVGLVFLLVLVFLQLALVMGMSDACHEPSPAMRRAAVAHLSGQPLSLNVSLNYIYCSGQSPSPLVPEASTISSAVNTSTSAFVTVQNYASLAGDPEVSALVATMSGAVQRNIKVLPVILRMASCVEVHNAVFNAVNTACRPVADDVYALLVVEGVLLGIWSLMRWAVVYPFCKCCSGSEDDRGVEDAMGMGLLENDLLDQHNLYLPVTGPRC